MRFYSTFKKIEIKRPLVFLCGPNSKDKENRRLILQKYIHDNIGEKDIYQPFAVIVDTMFDVKKIHAFSKKIQVSKLEEIVAAVAYKTYIFLDTMSTSYELGQFFNSKTQDDVCLFLDKEYKKRVNCSVGDYILGNFPKNKSFVKYNASYHPNGFVYFKNNVLPASLKNHVKKDFSRYDNNISLCFNNGTNEDGTIKYEINDNNLTFSCSLKSMFYLFSICNITSGIAVTKIKNKYELNEAMKKSLLVVKDFLKSALVCWLDDPFLEYSIKNIDIQIQGYPNDDSILSHIYYVIYALAEESKYTSGYKLPVGAKDFALKTSFIFGNENHNNIYGLTKIEINHIKNYIKNPNDYISEKHVSINGKNRKLIVYKNNNYGNILRNIHTKIIRHLQMVMPTASNSFAYKKKCSIKSCLNNHLNSTYFLKLDIKEFFNSISKTRFISLLNKCFKQKDYFQNDIRDFNRIVISCCFYKYKLPLGFVTSPIISDYFLYELDQKFMHKKVVYTRYADDILLSSNRPISKNYYYMISSFLNSKRGLKINTKKTLNKCLLHKGDSIRFLGVNIVRNNDKTNILTISKNRLITISKQFENDYKNLFYTDLTYFKSKYSGILNYVKTINVNCYKKLIRIIKVKTGLDVLQAIKI